MPPQTGLDQFPLRGSPVVWCRTRSWSRPLGSPAWEPRPTCSRRSGGWGCRGWWGCCPCRRTEERGRGGQGEGVLGVNRSPDKQERWWWWCWGGYQDVIGPTFPGKGESRLLQLHHMLVPAVGPVFGPQLPRVGPAAPRRTNQHLAQVDEEEEEKEKFLSSQLGLCVNSGSESFEVRIRRAVQPFNVVWRTASIHQQ